MTCEADVSKIAGKSPELKIQQNLSLLRCHINIHALQSDPLIAGKSLLFIGNLVKISSMARSMAIELTVVKIQFF
jgi:hypothetical protein